MFSWIIAIQHIVFVGESYDFAVDIHVILSCRISFVGFLSTSSLSRAIPSALVPYIQQIDFNPRGNAVISLNRVHLSILWGSLISHRISSRVCDDSYRSEEMVIFYYRTEIQFRSFIFIEFSPNQISRDVPCESLENIWFQIDLFFQKAHCRRYSSFSVVSYHHPFSSKSFWLFSLENFLQQEWVYDFSSFREYKFYFHLHRCKINRQGIAITLFPSEESISITILQNEVILVILSSDSSTTRVGLWLSSLWWGWSLFHFVSLYNQSKG